jgi:hypothetical protein
MTYKEQMTIDYTTKDYEGFFQYMKSLIPSILPEWTDYSQTDFGIVLLQLASYGLHIISYYQDKSYLENILIAAKTRKAVIDQCRLLNYELASQIPATVTLTFTKITARQADSITIPKGTKISTNPSAGEVITFETDEALTIAGGNLTGTVTATQGITVSNVKIGTGSNSINQKITIPVPEVYPASLEITTIEGVSVPWTRVINFINSLSSDSHFKATVNSDYYVELTFGDGTLGRKVPSGVDIKANYRVCKGIEGNVSANLINYIQDTLDGIASVNNTAAASGGTDYESIETAKTNAPALFSTAQRAVTKYDFVNIAKSIPAVSGKTVLAAEVEETFNDNGDVNIYIVPSDLGVAAEGLLQAVEDAIDAVKVINNHLTAVATTYEEYSITATATVTSNNVNADKKAEIEALLLDRLNTRYFVHGEKVYLSYITKLIMSVDGVLDCAVSAPAANVEPSTYEIVKITGATVTVTGGV